MLSEERVMKIYEQALRKYVTKEYENERLDDLLLNWLETLLNILEIENARQKLYEDLDNITCRR